VTHGFLLDIAELGMRFCVEDKETSNIDITFRSKRRAGIEPESGLPYHERKIFIPLILTQIIGHEKVVFSCFPIRLVQRDSILLIAGRMHWSVLRLLIKKIKAKVSKKIKSE
jgi:hypothetical protein